MLITYDDIKRDLKNEFLKQFPNVKVFDNNTFISIFLNIIAFGIYNLHKSILFLLKQTFANTANLEHLKLQATNRLEYLQATKSSGKVCINGDIGTTINSGEIFNLKNSNLQFKLLDNVTINEISYLNNDIDSIYSYEKICTIKFKNYTCFIIGMSISIENASINKFNGIWTINKIIDRYTIEITINDSRLLQEDLSTSYIKIKANIGIGNIESVGVGKINNISPFSILESSNSNIDFIGINYNGLTGGRDNETDEEYRVRYLQFLREPQAFFNENWIKFKILDNFPKVTRVDILTNEDEVNIYVINTNAIDLIVDSNTINSIKTYLFDTYKPINLPTNKFNVLNPTQQEITFNLLNIKPSANNSFKDVIKKELYNYVITLPIGGYMRLDLLKGFIYNIRDYENNYYIDSFDISLNNDVDIALGSILIPKIEIL
jgi:hypothetical protein